MGGGRSSDPGGGRLPLDHALQGTIESVRSIERDTGRRYTPLVLLPTFVDPRRPGAVDATALMRERFGDLCRRPRSRSARYDASTLAGVPRWWAAALEAAAAYRRAADDIVAAWGGARQAPRGPKDFVRADVREAFMAARRHRLESADEDPTQDPEAAGAGSRKGKGRSGTVARRIVWVTTGRGHHV